MKRLIRFYNSIDWQALFLWLFLYVSACAAYSLMEQRADSLGQHDIAGMALGGLILFGYPLWESWKDSKTP